MELEYIFLFKASGSRCPPRHTGLAISRCLRSLPSSHSCPTSVLCCPPSPVFLPAPFLQTHGLPWLPALQAFSGSFLQNPDLLGLHTASSLPTSLTAAENCFYLAGTAWLGLRSAAVLLFPAHSCPPCWLTCWVFKAQIQGPRLNLGARFSPNNRCISITEITIVIVSLKARTDLYSIRPSVFPSHYIFAQSILLNEFVN